MNEAELNAYGQMALALARHADGWARGWDFKFPGITKPVYHHLSDSTFESVANCLWKLKVFRALDEENGGAANFVIDCELEDAFRIAIANHDIGPSFKELLYTRIYLFGDYGTQYWGFSTRRNLAFGKDGQLTSVLDALVPLGYAERTEAGYIWTERVAPIMREAGYEDEWPVGQIP